LKENDYIKWRKGEEQRRRKDRERELLKQKETSSSSSSESCLAVPLSSFSFSFPSSSLSSFADLTQTGIMNDRFCYHYDPIKDQRLFSENIVRRKFVRWKEKQSEESKKRRRKLKGYILKESKRNNGGGRNGVRIDRENKKITKICSVK
jgi:hypothetical protein